MLDTHLLLLIYQGTSTRRGSWKFSLCNSAGSLQYLCQHWFPIGKAEPCCIPHPASLSLPPSITTVVVNCNRPQQQQITISNEVGLDCELWERFLQKGYQGISMGRITVCQPTRLSMLDVCPFEMGGCLLEGRSWHMIIPPASSPIYGQPTTNNFIKSSLGWLSRSGWCAWHSLQFRVTTCNWQQ